MRYSLSFGALFGLLAFGFVGCSGSGSGDSSASVKVRCVDGSSFCLVSCDLGCSGTGCSVTEIAENQRLRFTFSDRIDPASVNPATVSVRTATGVAPDADLLVSSSELTLVPRVRALGGVSSFGFQRNETYIITLAAGGGSSQGVRSLSGDPLAREFSCTVVASRGIIDADQLPPSVVMLAPVDVQAAPLDPTVVLRFSELVDTTPLQGTLTNASPIRMVLKNAVHGSNGLECDRFAAGVGLVTLPQISVEIYNGTPVTVVTLRPTVQLPGESCIQIVVSADMRDLSGRQAVPATFQFFTEPSVSTPLTFNETFASAANLDVRVSSGTWLNGARPAQIGFDGRHGTFNPALGTQVGSSSYEWNTDQITIPASHSFTGQEYTVTDGKFYFTDFIVPEGTTIRFTGSVPPQIWARGQIDVRGTLLLNAEAMPFSIPTSGSAQGQRVSNFNARGGTTGAAPFIDGQPGGSPGAGGGRGGNGGNECQGGGAIIIGGVVVTNGQNGQDVRVAAGHAFAGQAAGTGGKGSAMNPPNGINDSSPSPGQPLLGGVYRARFSPGGSGGGFSLPGGASSVTPIGAIDIGPLPAPGNVFNLLPFPPVPLPSPNYQAIDHFVVGGSGGGGGATHAFGTIYIVGDFYTAGHGGSGGGGAMALRAGGDLSVSGAAVLEAKGGQGVLITGDDLGSTSADVNWGISSPGGGGSGGSFLLQSNGNLVFNGNVDTTGGAGSRTGSISNASLNVTSHAGAGSVGFFRLEAGGTVSFGGSSVPTYVPATHSATLTDTDPSSGQTSLWRSSGRIFPPQWLRYELDVDTDGNGTIDITYTDTGASGTMKANDPNGPLVVHFQGGNLPQSGNQPIPGTIGPWREGVGTGGGSGIDQDSPLGFRFNMTFNRAMFPNCVVRGLRVYART